MSGKPRNSNAPKPFHEHYQQRDLVASSIPRPIGTPLDVFRAVFASPAATWTARWKGLKLVFFFPNRSLLFCPHWHLRFQSLQETVLVALYTLRVNKTWSKCLHSIRGRSCFAVAMQTEPRFADLTAGHVQSCKVMPCTTWPAIVAAGCTSIWTQGGYFWDASRRYEYIMEPLVDPPNGCRLAGWPRQSG